MFLVPCKNPFKKCTKSNHFPRNLWEKYTQLLQNPIPRSDYWKIPSGRGPPRLCWRWHNHPSPRCAPGRSPTRPRSPTAPPGSDPSPPGRVPICLPNPNEMESMRLLWPGLYLADFNAPFESTWKPLQNATSSNILCENDIILALPLCLLSLP